MMAWAPGELRFIVKCDACRGSSDYFSDIRQADVWADAHDSKAHASTITSSVFRVLENGELEPTK